MKGIGFLWLVTACIIGCNNKGDEPANSLLMQPPYKLLTDSIQEQKTSPALYYKRGILLLQNEQLHLAEADMQKAWTLKKDEAYALGLVALLRKKNGDTALSFIQQAIQQLPQSIALKISLARGLQQKGEIEQAIAICNEVIAQYPNQLDALQLKAELLTAQKKNGEALTTLETAYTYAPFDPELAHSLAFAYAEAKNIKVIALCDSLIKADLQAQHAEPYYFKGVYYANIKNKMEAIKQFNKAIQHDYNFLDAHMEKGTLFYDSRNYKEALTTFTLATTISPTFAEAYYWLGKTKEAMGNKAEAKLDYQRAYGLDKAMVEAKELADKMKNEK